MSDPSPPPRSRFTERLTNDPAFVVLARLAVLATPVLGSAVFGLLAWFGSMAWDDIRSVSKSVERIEATIGTSIERGVARDRRMDRIEVVNAEQQSDIKGLRNAASGLQGRVTCLEHAVTCPDPAAPPPY